MARVELMAPAGNMEAAESAIGHGADALYAGVSNLSMRPKRVEFRGDDFRSLARYVHDQGRKLYATLNICFKPQDDEIFKEGLRYLVNCNADGVILSDLGAIDYTRRHYPDLPIHVSIMVSVTNAEAALFYKELGASVIVLSRSLKSVDEARQIVERVDGVDFEVFVHGGICYMFDGKCYMSSYWKQEWIEDELMGTKRLFGQNNTKGECHLICKRLCNVERDRETIATGKIMRRPDQIGLEDIPAYMEMGIKILKIEGRAMPLEYVGRATQLYRSAVDLYLEDPERYSLRAEWLPDITSLIEARHEYERDWHIG